MKNDKIWNYGSRRRSELQSVDKLKMFGVIIDTVGYDYSHQHDGIYSRVCFTLRRLYRLNMYLPYHVRQKVARALMISPISYCLEVCLCTITGNVRKIKQVSG